MALLCGVSAAQTLVPLNPGATPAASQRPRPTADPGKYIVMFAPGTSRSARAQAAIQSGAAVRINYQNLNAIAITVPNANALNGLRNNPNVLGIYPDYKFSDGAKPVTPSTPTAFMATAVSDSQIDLVWANGGGAPETYEIERCTGATCLSFSPLVTVPASPTSYSDSGLAANTTYRYQIRACISRGATPCSAFTTPPIGATTLAATPPNAPSGLTATPVSPTQVNLNWVDNSGNEQGFRIFRCTGSGCNPTAQLVQLTTPNTTSYGDTSAAADMIYRYSVVAYNTAGNSVPSNIAEAHTPPVPTVPAAPSGLTATPVGPTQVDLMWTDNANNELGFRVFRCSGGSCTPTQLIELATVNLQTYSDTTVTENTLYSYYVVAYNAVGPSSPSNQQNIQTPPVSTAPNAPSNLAVTSVSASAIGLSWSDNSSDETGFQIERCSGAACGGFSLYASVGANTNSYTDSAVGAATTYRYQVRAAKSGEFSGYSNIAEGTTSPIGSPPAETPITGGTRQRVPAGVQRVGPPGLLADGTPSDGAGIGIAVLDSGLDYNHEDLQLAPEQIGINSFNGFDPDPMNPTLSSQDNRGHGTHVAGIIAARNNNIGVVGVAPNATLYGVKVLASDGTGDETNVTAGLDWVIGHWNLVNPPIRVVNMSLGRALDAGETVSDPTAFHTAIQMLYNLGIVVVASAGNDAGLATTQQVPSGYKEVFAVAGSVAEPGQNGCAIAQPVVPADSAAIFTSDGAYVSGVGGVTTSAPSEERDDWLFDPLGLCFLAINGIQSTSLGGGTSRLLPLPEGPSEGAGTSFAAPHVSGVVARIIQTGVVSAAPPSDGPDVEAIRDYIRTTADRREITPPDPSEPPPAPLDMPVDMTQFGLAPYTFDGEREGIAQAPTALNTP